MGLVRIALEASSIVQNSYGNRQNWAEFLWQWMGLVRVPMVVDWVGHNSFGSRGDWSV